MRASPASPLVSRPLLLPLRVLWVAVLAVTLIAIGMSVPILYAQGHQLCHNATGCNGPQLLPAQLRSLHRTPLTLDFYAGYMAVLNVVFGLVYCATAALIFLRRSQDRMALLSAFFLVIFGGLTFPGVPATVVTAHPALQIPAGLITVTGAALLTLFFFLFPNGRFVPSWAPWLVPVLPLLQAPGALFPNSPFTLQKLPLPIGMGAFFGVLLVTLGAQIYRFRRVSTVQERQQTKWVVLGVGIGLAGFLTFVALGIFLPPSFGRSVFSAFLAQTATYGFMLLIPLSIGLAILRYNLWEADALINRTLVYGSLTLSVAAAYLGGVIALQAVARLVTGQSSDLAIAIVTLAVAALFNPWRRRLQTFIDRRFYRRKYDAARTLAAFTVVLRDEVDIDRLAADMLAITDETMKPACVGLWLR
ncbi:MAG TPA: hypothetical protein VFB58_00735 [Chloroflexota bacterium]|nr:hypothetical protein [Chloroflexota bacterium]